MILYLDTSAFIKLYVEEPGTPAVREAMARAFSIATHLITYAEMRAALARLRRMGRDDERGFAEHKREFEQDWRRLQCLLPDEATVREAGDLAEQYNLRGYDSLHLAAASRLQRQLLATMTFACFDQNLNHAARALGLRTLAPEL